MFLEYRDLISKPKTQDYHFRRPFDGAQMPDEKLPKMRDSSVPTMKSKC